MLCNLFVLRAAPQFASQISLDKFDTTYIYQFPAFLAHDIYLLEHEEVF